MSNDFRKKAKDEFEKLQSDEEKRYFIENVRFLITAEDEDFSNYCSDKEISESEFYSIVDKLHQLDNLEMLIRFIERNRRLLSAEVDREANNGNILDYSRYGKVGNAKLEERFDRLIQDGVLGVVRRNEFKDIVRDIVQGKNK